MKTTASTIGLLLALAVSCFAKLEFKSTSVELKARPSDTQLEAQFTFKNTGKEEAEIEKISIGCSCLSAETDKKVYKPGEEDKVDVVFRLGSFTGHQKKGLTIISGEQRERLSVGVQIPNVITISPDIAEWTVGEKPGPKRS